MGREVQGAGSEGCAKASQGVWILLEDTGKLKEGCGQGRGLIPLAARCGCSEVEGGTSGSS